MKPAAAILLVGVLVAGCSKPDPQALLKRGTDYLTAKKYPEAIVELSAAIQADPRLTDARIKLADAYLATNNGSGALDELVRAADLRLDDTALQLRVGRLLLAAGKFDDAMARANKVLDRNRGNVEAQVLRGNALAGLHEFDAAIKDYEEAIAASPDQLDAYLGLGTVNLASGVKEEAEDAFKQAVKVDPRSIPARLGLAHFYLRTDRVAAAEKELQAALQLEPGNLIVNRAMAILMIKTGRAPQAEPYMVAIAAGSKTPAARQTLAQYFLALGRRPDARKIYEELTKDAALRADASTQLAVLDALEGKDAQAKARVEEVLKTTPKHQRALIVKGELLLKERRYTEAFDAAKAAIAQSPPSASAQIIIGRVYEATSRLDDATAAYQEAIKISRGATPATLRLAWIEYRRGQLDKAASYANQVMSIERGNTEAFGLLARIDMRKGELTTARKRVAALQKVAPTAAITYTLQAEIQTASKDLGAARASYQRALQIDPANFDAIVGANRIDTAAGRHKDAIARVEAGLARTSRDPLLLVQAARTYGASGNTAKAESLLLESIQKDPTKSAAYSLLGQWYTSQRRLPDAIKQFEAIARNDPKSVGPITMIGMLYEVQGRTAEAEKQYEKALSVNARAAAVAANNLAWIYAESGRSLDRAMELAQTAYQQHPDDPTIADTLGWIYVKRNLASNGLPYLLQADATNATVQYHRGVAYVQLGDFDQARRALKTALAGSRESAWTADARKALASLQ